MVMWRWRTLFGLAFLVLVTAAHIIPVHGYFIEQSPDGRTSLGEVTAEDIRVLGLIAGSLPFVLLAVIVWLSSRIRQATKRRTLYVGVAFVSAVLMLVYTLHAVHG